MKEKIKEILKYIVGFTVLILVGVSMLLAIWDALVNNKSILGLSLIGLLIFAIVVNQLAHLIKGILLVLGVNPKELEEDDNV